MLRLLYYTLFIFLSFFLSFIFYLLFGGLLLTQFVILLKLFVIIIKFFFKYFIPIYMALSLYSIEYRGYYNLKFFGYDNITLKVYALKLNIFIMNVFYKYKILSIFLFSIFIIFSLFFEKIYFLIIIFFILIIFILLYIYNNINILKLYIEKYHLWCNSTIFLIFIYLLKLNDLNLNYDSNFYESFGDFIYKISSPRWWFKSSYPFLYPEYKKEINYLKKGLRFYNSYLYDAYLKKYENKGLGLSHSKINDIINKNFNQRARFIKKSYLLYSLKFKDLYIFDYLRNNKSLKKNENYNKLLFDLQSNKSFNYEGFNDNIKKHKILFKYKNIYAKSYLKELKLSKNLLINTNLNVNNYVRNIQNYYELDNTIFNSFNKSIDSYLNNLHSDKVENIGFIRNQIFLNLVKDKYSDDYLRLKLQALSSLNFSNLLEKTPQQNSTYSYNLKKFMMYSAYNNKTYNKYEVYLNSDMFKIANITSLKDLQLIINKNNKNIYIEFFIKHLNKSYKYYNLDSNAINWSNDYFINILDSKKIKYDYWNEVRSKKDLEEKDNFNLCRNFNVNYIYDIKKKLELFNYNEFKKGGTHYEEVVLTPSVKNALLHKADIKESYFRFINYNRDYEIFLNSYLWLSLENSNIVLDSYDILIDCNDYLNEYKSTLEEYKEKTFFNFNSSNDLRQHTTHLLTESLKKEDKSKEDVAEIDYFIFIRHILKLDFFIKNLMFYNDYYNNNNYTWNYIYEDIDVSDLNSKLYPVKTKKFIFLDKYCNIDNIDYLDFNLFTYINNLHNIYITKYSKFVLPDSYKNYILRLRYSSFVNDHKDLFKARANVEPFNFTIFFNEMKDIDLYMNEDEFFHRFLINNLVYYQNYLIHFSKLNNFVEETLNSLCGSIYKETDQVVLHLYNMIDIGRDIVDNDLYDKNKIFLKKMAEITNESSSLTQIFVNYRKALNGMVDLNTDMPKEIDNFRAVLKEDSVKSIAFNQEILLNYLSEKNLNLVYLDEYLKLITEILDEYERLVTKSNSFNDIIDRKCIFLDHDNIYNNLRLCQNAITNHIDYNYRKHKCPPESLYAAYAFDDQLTRLNKVLIKNNIYLNERIDFLDDSINELKLIEERVSIFINNLKKLKVIIENIKEKIILKNKDNEGSS